MRKETYYTKPCNRMTAPLRNLLWDRSCCNRHKTVGGNSSIHHWLALMLMVMLMMMIVVLMRL